MQFSPELSQLSFIPSTNPNPAPCLGHSPFDSAHLIQEASLPAAPQLHFSLGKDSDFTRGKHRETLQPHGSSGCIVMV